MTSLPKRGYSPPVMNRWQHIGAFVLQLLPATNIAAGRFEGRVEHVASSQAAHFHCVEELLLFLDQVLKESNSPQRNCQPEADAIINRNTNQT